MNIKKLAIAPLLGSMALGGTYISETDYRDLRTDLVTVQEVHRHNYEDFTRVRRNEVILSRNSVEDQATLDEMYEKKKARFGLVESRMREKRPITLYDEQRLFKKIVGTELEDRGLGLPQITNVDQIPKTLEEHNQLFINNLK